MIVRAILWTLCIASQVHADTVWLQPMPPTKTQSDWYPRSIQKLSGEVIDIDAKHLRIKIDGDDAESIYAAWRVIWIEPAEVSPLQAEAIALFNERRDAESLSKLSAVLKEKPPVWRQQFLTMMAANAARETDRGKIALELVSQLDRRSLSPLVIAWLPIAWTGERSAANAAAATERLSDDSIACRLVAASWLLSSPSRADAIEVIDAIANQSQRPALAAVARALKVRWMSPPEIQSSHKTLVAESQKMPMVLQVGPAIAIVERLTTAGLADQAKPLLWSLDLTPIHPHPALRRDDEKMARE